MARSWPEYLEEFSAYLDALRRVPAVGFSLVPQVPERPGGLVPEECVERVAQLHLECEVLMVEMSEHMVELAKRATLSPSSPHGGRGAAYIETDM